MLDRSRPASILRGVRLPAAAAATSGSPSSSSTAPRRRCVPGTPERCGANCHAPSHGLLPLRRQSSASHTHPASGSAHGGLKFGSPLCPPRESMSTAAGVHLSPSRESAKRCHGSQPRGLLRTSPATCMFRSSLLLDPAEAGVQCGEPES